MDFFDKHNWLGSAVGVLLGFLLARIWDFFSQLFAKPAKNLAFNIQGKSIIKGIDKEGLEVTYHGEPLQRLDLYRIGFHNVGSTPLEKIPVVITASGPLRGKVSYKGPDGNVERVIEVSDAEDAVQKFSFDADFRKLSFERSLLNAKETFSIEFFIADGSGDLPNVSVRSPGLHLSASPDSSMFISVIRALPDFAPYPVPARLVIRLLEDAGYIIPKRKGE